MNDSTKIDVFAANNFGATYDAACKRLFRNKEILAPILKYTVREYKDVSTEDIIRFIDRDSISDIDPVSDVPIYTDGMDSEMSSVADKLVRYDKRFRAAVPGEDGELDCSLHFDLEIQNNYSPSSPSYPIPKRAVYYAARELSSQLGSITQETNYTKLRKCYSIWICNDNIPRRLQNTVTAYRMQPEFLAGNASYDKDFDLMEVVMILRGKESSSFPVLDYLDGLFQSDLRRIEKHVDIGSNDQIVMEVKNMGGLGAAIAEKNFAEGRQEGWQVGRQEGVQEGRREGHQEGVQESKITVVRNMLRRNYSAHEISVVVEIPEDQVAQIAQETKE